MDPVGQPLRSNKDSKWLTVHLQVTWYCSVNLSGFLIVVIRFRQDLQGLGV